MKCKRCGKELVIVGKCESCIREEISERRSINWSGIGKMRDFVALDEKIEDKYRDAGQPAEE